MTNQRISPARVPGSGPRTMLRWRAGATLGAIAGMSAFAGVGGAYADETCTPAASCVELASGDTDERLASGTIASADDRTTGLVEDGTGGEEPGVGETGGDETGEAGRGDAESTAEGDDSGEVEGAAAEDIPGAEDVPGAEDTTDAAHATAPDPEVATLAVGEIPQVAPSDITCFTDPSGSVSCFGSGEPGAGLHIETADGATVCETTVQSDGTWMCVSPGPELPTTAVATDRTGTMSPPVALPTLPSRISCESAAGGIVACAGLSAAGAAIVVLDGNGAEVCSTTADGDGSWSCTSTGPVTATPLAAMLGDATGGVGSGYYGIPVSPAPAATAPDPAPAPAPDPEHTPAPMPSQDDPGTPSQDGVAIAPQAAAPVDTTRPAAADASDVAEELAETGRDTDIAGAAFAGAAIIALGALLCTGRRRVEA